MPEAEKTAKHAAELDRRIREHKRVLALMASQMAGGRQDMAAFLRENLRVMRDDHERILPIQGQLEYAARRVALVETAREYGLVDA